ncbi:MAG TPA: hypothetical protein VMR44_01355 [Thermoanaerobaculia bacterium]|nr:hypothetical protein [Thermoanaerobaculia bacterium]
MRRTPALVAVVLGVALLVVQPAPRSSADAPERVIVTNFPELQRVAGSVTVPEPIPHSALVRRLDVIVPAVDRAATTQLVEAGAIDAAGFTHAVLGLRGEVQGNLLRDGVAGAVLVPDEEPVVRALLEEGRYELSLEVEAAVLRAERGLFASGQSRQVLGFPRYRVFLYNTSDRSVEADLYVYLTN